MDELKWKIPNGWELKKLKDVFNINELSLSANTPADYSFRYIPIEQVYTNRIIYEDCESFRFADAPGRARRIVRENDILISGVRPNLKAFAIFKKPKTKESWICSTGLFVLTAKKEEDNLISFYELLSEIGESQFYSFVAGTNYPAIGDYDIRNLHLLLPISKKEKESISSFFSKVDEAIAAVESSIAAAERLKKSLMQNLLTGKMKPDGTFRTPEEFYIDEKFGKVPVGWEVKKLKEVCTNTGEYGANASAIPFNGLTPRYIRITDIDDFGNLIDEDKATIDAENYDKYLLQDDDFLFARTGDTVGKSLLYKRAQMGMAVYAGYLIKYTFDKEKIIPEYFNVIAQSEFFERFKVAMKRIGAKPNINSGEYSSFKFLLPKTTQEQLAILSRFNDVDTIISKNNSKLIVLGKLKKSLMQNLLTGKVRIINNNLNI